MYFKVGYSQKEDGAYTFEDKSDWVEGMLEFIPKVAESVAKSTEEEDALWEAANEAIKARLEELRTEAGPEEEVPPSTSDDWEAEHQKISDELKNWRQ